MSEVLITGGGGFIGAWIIRRLIARGDEVRVLDTRDDRRIVREIVGEDADRVDWRVGDVSRRQDVLAAAAGCSQLLHLAAVLTPACKADPIRGAEINLIGTLAVFEAAREAGIGAVIYMSSAGVFGPNDGVAPRPTTHYGAFKLASEGSARAYWEDCGIASVGFRPLVVYGPGREVGLTAGPTLACRAAAEGRPYVIPYAGPSDYVFVDDVAAAFIAAADSQPKGARVYNLTGARAEMDGLLAAIEAASPGARITASGPVLPVAADIEPSRVREDFRGVPRTSLRDGIALTVAHYRR